MVFISIGFTVPKCEGLPKKKNTFNSYPVTLLYYLVACGSKARFKQASFCLGAEWPAGFDGAFAELSASFVEDHSAPVCGGWARILVGVLIATLDRLIAGFRTS